MLLPYEHWRIENFLGRKVLNIYARYTFHNRKLTPAPKTFPLQLPTHQIPHSSFFVLTTMGIAFDYAPDRPEHIEAILNGLDRYNPETTTIFQDYVTQQCEDRTYDCYANLALLKL